VRTPQQVAESLFRISRPTPDDAPAPPRPENKRVWASLLKGKDAVIQEVAEEMERRDPSASKTRVALTDGERALQIRVDRKLKVTLILDLMHALEKCGRPLMSSMPRAAWRPISGSSTALCESCQAVWARWLIKGLRQSITKRALSGANRKTLEGVTEYLYRNRTRMRYHEYLAHGWPNRQWSGRRRL